MKDDQSTEEIMVDSDTNETDEKRRKPKHGSVPSALSTIGLLIFAAGLGLFLTKFVFQTFAVDGNSMSPTLATNDRLIVSKLPSTWARVTGNAYSPKRGDVVVLDQNHLTKCGQSEEKVIIKRVVGVAGDRVTVKNGDVTVYNKDKPQGFDPDRAYASGTALGTTPMDIEVTVKKGEIFVLGDNRKNSCDSRSFGATQTDRIIGKLFLRIAPISKAKVF